VKLGDYAALWTANIALIQTLALIAGLWVASDLGYYLIRHG
jgi:hypothetical protein